MPQFDVSTFPSQVFWLLVCFLFLWQGLARWVFPRLETRFAEREAARLQKVQETEEWLQNGAALRIEGEERLRKTRKEISAMLAQAHEVERESFNEQKTAMEQEHERSLSQELGLLRGKWDEVRGGVEAYQGQFCDLLREKIREKVSSGGGQ